MAINVLLNYEFIVGNVIIVKCLLVNSWHNSLINFTNRLLMDWVQALQNRCFDKIFCFAQKKDEIFFSFLLLIQYLRKHWEDPVDIYSINISSMCQFVTKSNNYHLVSIITVGYIKELIVSTPASTFIDNQTNEHFDLAFALIEKIANVHNVHSKYFLCSI